MIIYTSDEFDKGYNSSLQINKLYYKSNIIYGKDVSYVKVTFTDTTYRTDYYSDGIVPQNTYNRNTGITSVEMNGISEISASAFNNCSSLSSVTFNKELQTIGSSAFSGCSSLVLIDFGNTRSTIPTLENVNAFDGLPNNYKIVVPDALESSWKSANNWSSIASHIVSWSSVYGVSYVKVTFTDNTYRIDVYSDGIVPQDVYSGNTRITSVEMNRINEISARAFNGCSNMNTLIVNGDINRIGSYGFTNCNSLSSVKFNGNINNIGEHAFDGADLRSISLNSGSTTMGNYVFANNENLAKVTIGVGVVENIPNYAFYNCSKLNQLTLGNGINTIGDSAFGRCELLIRVDVPSSVSSIGSSAFNSCFTLRIVTIPNSVTSIASYTFGGCPYLVAIDFGNTRSTIPTLENVNAFSSTSNDYKIVVPDSLVSSWKTANNWSSIASHIVSYSSYYN